MSYGLCVPSETENHQENQSIRLIRVQTYFHMQIKGIRKSHNRANRRLKIRWRKINNSSQLYARRFVNYFIPACNIQLTNSVQQRYQLAWSYQSIDNHDTHEKTFAYSKSNSMNEKIDAFIDGFVIILLAMLVIFLWTIKLSNVLP